MNQTIVLPARFYAAQGVRDALMQVAVHHRDGGIRRAAEAARSDLFDVDAAEVQAVIASLGDHPYARRLTETLAELQETTRA